VVEGAKSAATTREGAKSAAATLAGKPAVKPKASGGGVVSTAASAKPRPDAVDRPGSKAYLAKEVDGVLQIGAQETFDYKQAAAALGIAPESKCWPVLASNKQGLARLALCPCIDKHRRGCSEHAEPTHADWPQIKAAATKKTTNSTAAAAKRTHVQANGAVTPSSRRKTRRPSHP
jgi:hypothetical protein